MTPTKKTNPPAFNDILAGLQSGAAQRAGPGRASAGRASPDRASADRAPKPAAGIDVSWIETAQARARAAQMAHQTSAAAAPEPEKTSEPAKDDDAADRPRRHRAGLSWGRRAGEEAHAASDAQASGAEDAMASAPAGAASKATAHSAEAAPLEDAPKANPVHALRRLLSQLPWGWWRVEAVAANDRKEPAAAETEPNPRPTAPAPPRSEDEAIAEELGLRADLAVVDLRRIRRDFAKKNHPDRFEPALRVSAARRMTIANMLIDAHMKQTPK